jgi:hypothetical protein
MRHGQAASLRLHERNAELTVALTLATWRLARADPGTS